MKKITDENVKAFLNKYKDYFDKCFTNRNAVSRIKALFSASNVDAACKLAKSWGLEDRIGWQARRMWGFRNERVEHCFVCNKLLHFDEDELMMLDSDAIYFSTHGNWPSSVLDLEDEEIRILICDECFKERQSRAFIEKSEIVRESTTVIPFTKHRERQLENIERRNKRFLRAVDREIGERLKAKEDVAK